MWYKMLKHFVPRFSANKVRYKMCEYFLQTTRLICVVSLMVGKKYSRILYHFRPIFLLTENTYAFRTSISAQYFLVQNTHAFFTTCFRTLFSGTKYSHIFYRFFRTIFSGTKYSRIFYDFFGKFARGTKYSRIFYRFFH